jgi:hypothetical protein
MVSGNVLELPMRNPGLFSAEVNCRVLANGEFGRLLYAAIRALPYVEDARSREDLKQALCELILPDAA